MLPLLPSRPELDDVIHRPAKIALLVDALGAEGIAATAVLAGSGLGPAAVLDAATRVSARQLLAVHANALRLAPTPGFALRTGLRTRITHFGLYGYALLASATARQAIDFALRYRALASPLIGLAFEHRAGTREAAWVFDDPLELGRDSALRRFVVELQLGTQLALHRDLLGAALVPRRVRLRDAAPAHAALYGELLGCPVSFGERADELSFEAAWLDHPLAFASPVNAELARRTCDQLLAEMEHARGAMRPDDMAGRVAALLLRSPGQFPDAATVAGQLGLHERSLRRRLSAEGRSFQALRDEVRCKLARDYLRDTQMSTEDIAAALGFGDAANFRHAFKRWTGESPGVVRRRDRQGD
jgi:AraC-like DNA-binding protein